METKKEKLVIAILASIIGILWFMQQELLHTLYTLEPDYTNMEAEIASLKKINLQLEDELLLKESLQYIDSEARRQGFVSMTVIYLNE